MAVLLPEFIQESAERAPDAPALLHKDRVVTYTELSADVRAVASGLRRLDLMPNERVAVYLPKQVETVLTMFGASAAGAVFVPINPLLKPTQVGHILRDCNVRVLVTSADRATALSETLRESPDLRHLVIVGTHRPNPSPAAHVQTVDWNEVGSGDGVASAARIDTDLAAILYTSGSTGRPKGVVLSHRNMVAGAHSVATYLKNTAADRLLAVLPFSFDYGLSQLTTAFSVGASVVLMEYLLPRDVIRAVGRYGISGLAAVPPLWNQLAALEWPDEARRRLRYLTNSGGAMPRATTHRFRELLPDAEIFLMYGLTEAFRSTYLPPELIDEMPDSMGKAIPNADVRVVREDGSECEPNEPGELVHRGALVALGYWNDPERTAQRFRPAPGHPPELPNPEMSVWSGDQVRRDERGFLYFVSRKDEMIKTSGYRVSPTEVEEVVYGFGNIAQVVALGAPHGELGQGVVVVVQPAGAQLDTDAVMAYCLQELPRYMVPAAIEKRAELPRNANGKIDRKTLSDQYRDFFDSKGNA